MIRILWQSMYWDGADNFMVGHCICWLNQLLIFCSIFIDCINTNGINETRHVVELIATGFKNNSFIIDPIKTRNILASQLSYTQSFAIGIVALLAIWIWVSQPDDSNVASAEITEVNSFFGLCVFSF